MKKIKEKSKGQKIKKKEFSKSILEEFKFIAIVYVIFYIFLQIHYHKENPLTLLNVAFAHFYLFIIPGYSLCLVFSSSINKIERLVIGTGLGYALQPFLLYFINFFIKVNIMSYYIYVSFILIVIGIIFFSRSLKK